MEKRKEPVLVHGHIRDKLEVIKIVSAKVKQKFPVDGNVDIVKVGDYDAEIDGHLCVAEFVCKDASFVRGRNHK
jgi:hypothetical protein